MSAGIGTGIGSGQGQPQAARLNYTTSEAGNPFVGGWYAEPGSAVYDGVFWVYPTTSRDAEEQTYIDAFSSPDLINWTKHANVLTTESVAWATKALRAPTPIKRNGKYYLYFSANDLREEDEVKGEVGGVGGIGVAVADKPEGPFVDAIGEPLIGGYYNGVQPSDQDVFIDDDDDDGKIYIYYGGNSRANVALLSEDMVSLATFTNDDDDGGATTTTTFKEITPSKNYANGIKMVKRKGAYYMTWSEGDWAGSDYSVAYAMADNPLGPFLVNEQRQRLVTIGTGTGTGTTILQPDSAVAMGTGHHSVMQVPDEDIWYIIYHRRPLKESNERNHRVLAYDRLYFNDEDGGTIRPVEMLVKDNFADGAMLAWTAYGGEWAVEGQRLAIPYGGSGMALLDTDFSDLIFDTNIATTEGKTGHPGLLFRVSELSPIAPGRYKYKGYKAAISPSGVITLGKADMGVFTDLAQTRMRMEMGTEYHVRVVAVGSAIEVFVDDMDVPKIKYVDDSFKSGANGVRVFNAAATFGSVSVARPYPDSALSWSRNRSQKGMAIGTDREDKSSANSWDDDVPEKISTYHDGKEVERSNAKISRSSLSLLLCGTDRLFKSDRISKS